MFSSGKGAAAIVKEKGIEQLSDMSAIEKLCDEVIAATPNRRRILRRAMRLLSISSKARS